MELEDRIITDFLFSLGPWRESIVIGGGYALFIYKLYLTDQALKNPPVATRDIDSLIPRKIPTLSKKNIATYLQESGFTPIFKDADIPATESYIKEIEGLEVEIEFITDSSTRYDKNKNVVVAGVVAQPLSYLKLSLETTLSFTTTANLTGKVVSPAAWIFHKGLTFPKRKTTQKILKDLYGIWYVTTQLGEFSEAAIIEFSYLANNHPKWFSTLQQNLLSWEKAATPAAWLFLESQDPSGRLKKLSFQATIKKLSTAG